MKKTFIIFALMCISTVGFASQIGEFEVGVNVGYENFQNLESIEDFDFSNSIFGAEARLRLFFVESGLAGNVTTDDNNSLHFSGMATLGASYDFLDVLRIGAGIGPYVDYFNDGDSQTVYLGGNEVTAKDFVSSLKTSPLYFKFSADILAGDVLRLGVTYVTPTAFVLENTDLNKVFPTSENFADGKLSFVILMKLF